MYRPQLVPTVNGRYQIVHGATVGQAQTGPVQAPSRAQSAPLVPVPAQRSPIDGEIFAGLGDELAQGMERAVAPAFDRAEVLLRDERHRTGQWLRSEADVIFDKLGDELSRQRHLTTRWLAAEAQYLADVVGTEAERRAKRITSEALAATVNTVHDSAQTVGVAALLLLVGGGALVAYMIHEAVRSAVRKGYEPFGWSAAVDTAASRE